MIGWAPHDVTPWWVVVLFVLAGAAVGLPTARELATTGYRTDFDELGPRTPRWSWLPVVLGLLWGWLAWRIGDLAGWAALPAYLLFAWIAVVLIGIDADVHRLPDGIVLPAYPALLALVVVATAGSGDWGALWRALACLAGMYAVYFVLHLISPASLGFGDVKLSGLIGLVLGWLGVMQVLVATFAGFLVGGLMALVLLVGRRAGLKSHIAFGPAMLVGAFVAIAVEYRLV
ncbi:prepilin peptidase [Knoellia koreensis]|uniref:prepilin peptidase n=1 Tax=Knoellia koreensis TaxID=2730921 RepID=UPI003211F655